jgi:Ca-activated chloride channel homolog
MKRLTTIASMVIMVLILLLSACASQAPAPTTTTTTQPTWTTPRPTTVAPTTAVPRPSATTPAATPWPTTHAPTITQMPAPTITIPGPYPTPFPTTPGTGTIGLATGGAKDTNNFRENIRNNYLPLPTDMTYEGLFYDYYFDTGIQEPTNKLFSPSYSQAVTRDPLSQQTEYYLSVGLNSGLRQEDFTRKKLNLVIVMDDSGSMGERYNQYYYDRFGQSQDAYAGEGVTRISKMESANNAVVSILNQLNSGDRFSIVLFNSNASLAKPMGLVKNTDMAAIKSNVLDVHAGGGTNLSSGLTMAIGQLHNLREVDSYDYENRIIILTDAQPNAGDLNSASLMSTIQKNAEGRIYTTFIGVGVDFNSDLVNEITQVKGANYYSVHAPREFRERVESEFDYMVTPLVFNVQLKFQSSGWRIEKVFGSPEADQATGQLMKINTLFPSKSEGGENKGGLVLLKLRKLSPWAENKVYLKVTYEDRDGRSDISQQVISMEQRSPEYFDNSGIRKGVLLSRYASLLQNWMIDERQHAHYSAPWEPCVREDTGIIIPPEPGLSQWERTSLPLMVSGPYKTIFRNFSRYFEDEMSAIKDYTLEQEIEIMDVLSK